MYPMRRKDRQRSREFAEAVIDKSPYGVMATAGSDGLPYSVVLSMVRDGEYLYFHSALEGRKIDNLRDNPKVCVSFVGETLPLPEEYSIRYESAVVSGTALELSGREEKIHGLRLICERWAAGNMAAFDAAVEKSLDRTAIWKIHIDEIWGKARD
ncbi:MAG: pyridoxamine 5'-phosphate oxidase family protein [Treponema sp.]|jgi:nitroimidazol reductase NimA-like FMN-containing flavoprotein (pyridoxamine 5'-phosphate oxidase superfamily)|nr:pyridoxamine 5'-phosphate oxidase family protein [Treponema sp.]